MDVVIPILNFRFQPVLKTHEIAQVEGHAVHRPKEPPVPVFTSMCYLFGDARSKPSLVNGGGWISRNEEKIRQNLGFSSLYNVIAIPIAMSGLLNLLIAVSAMLLSSLSDIANTLLLIRKAC
jgi:hypothetical protein